MLLTEDRIMNTSHLIAAYGKTKGVLAQCYGRSPEQARKAVRAICLDTLGEDVETKCIDTEALPGLWITGDADYIRSQVAA
jgi:hypothetical protein